MKELVYLFLLAFSSGTRGEDYILLSGMVFYTKQNKKDTWRSHPKMQC